MGKSAIIFWIVVGLLILGAVSGGTTAAVKHHHKSDPCSTAMTKSSDPYVSDADANRAIADCITSLGGQP